MSEPAALWDYFVLTASHERQAEAYRMQLDLRRRLGLLAGVGEAMVVPDPGGQRIGSGGSTVLCLCRVLETHLPADAVMVHQGWWHHSGSVNVLTETRISDMGEQAAYYDSFCRLEPAA